MRWLLLFTVFALMGWTAPTSTAYAGSGDAKIVLKDGSTLKVDKGQVSTEKNMLLFRSNSSRMLLSKALVDWAATWQKMPEMVAHFKPEIASKQKKHVRKRKNIAITNDTLSNLEEGKGLTDEWTQDKETAVAMAHARANANKPKSEPSKRRDSKNESASRSGKATVDVITRGDEVTLTDHLVTGKYVIFDFYADWCGPCKRLDPHLKAMVKKYPNNVALKKIDIIRWQTPVAKQYRINSIPYLKLYDPKGKEVMDGGGQAILSYLEQTARRKKW